MSVTFDGNDLNLKGVFWDHLITEHGLADCDSAMACGWKRKSKWYGDEREVKSQVNTAFDLFRQWAKRVGTVELAQNAQMRSTFDIDTGTQCGTGVNGQVTQCVRLVMEIKHSGDTLIVTAFPW
ncbi:hypothetical protein D3C76_917540 [compost metagenome]